MSQPKLIGTTTEGYKYELKHVRIEGQSLRLNAIGMDSMMKLFRSLYANMDKDEMYEKVLNKAIQSLQPMRKQLGDISIEIVSRAVVGASMGQMMLEVRELFHKDIETGPVVRSFKQSKDPEKLAILNSTALMAYLLGHCKDKQLPSLSMRIVSGKMNLMWVANADDFSRFLNVCKRSPVKLGEFKEPVCRICGSDSSRLNLVRDITLCTECTATLSQALSADEEGAETTGGVGTLNYQLERLDSLIDFDPEKLGLKDEEE